MARQPQNQIRSFDLLSQPMQQRLQARIAEQNNNVTAVQQDVERQLAALDRQEEPQEETARRRYQAERALLIAQRTFLQSVEPAEKPEAQPRGLWLRARRS